MREPPNRARWVWGLLWFVLASLLVARAARRPESRGVILDHLEFGRRLSHGEDVYGPWRSDPDAPVRPLHAPYPPSFGLLTAPFAAIDAALGKRAARTAWALLQVACLLAVALVLRRLAAPRAPPDASTSHWHGLWLLLFLLGARFVLRDTHGGGGNLVNLAWCLLAFDASERDRPRAAGLWLGLSLATKPTQLWLLPVLLGLGRGRAVAWTLLTGLGAIALTVLLQRFDVAPWWRWLEGTWRLGTQADAFAVPAMEFPPFEWMNQSLRCAVARWCGTVPDEFAAKVAWGVVPGLSLPLATVVWITRALSFGALLAVVFTAWRTRASAAARVWVFAATLVLSVMLGPLSWKAHYVVLLPMLFLLLQRAVADSSPRVRRRTWWLLGAFAVCCLPGEAIVGDAGDEWQNSVYLVTAWAAALLLLALRTAHSLAHEHREAALLAEPSQRLG